VKVLIIDKDPDEINLIQEGLNGQDFEVFDADDREDAIAKLKENTPEIILADFDMPEFGGVDLINNLLAADVEIYPYIIFITEKNSEKQVIEALGPIPGDFLFRPAEEAELRARMAIAERTLALQSRIRESAGQTESLAMYDQLTNLLNRQAIYERALAELNRSNREGIEAGLAMIEVANLEDIEKEYGEEVRDQAIRFVARASRANVRIYDLVGRWIGAKFLLMLPGLSSDNIQTIFERIHKAITTIRVRVPDGERLKLDVRVGYTNADADNPVPLYILIEHVNKALEDAAKSGRNPVVRYQEE
jgi:diguanylate cyclase (GGDEF)-like protein